MLDLPSMKSILVDPAARTAVAGPGLVWSELDAATQTYRLATTGGVVGSTGIAGLTLGGGIGFMDRMVGLTCDNLLGAEVVTADGQVLQADEDTNPDLFRALRGGGGNFGVVTSFRYRLYPVTEVFGGCSDTPWTARPRCCGAYREVSADAPDRLALYAGLVAAPPAPFIPQHLRGQRVAGLIPVYFGSGDQTMDEMVAAATDAPSPLSVIVLKRTGGATRRVPADATPFRYRDATHNLDVHAQWAPGSPPEPQVAWARAARQAAQPDSAGGGYVNFLGAGQGTDRVRAAYGGNYARLTQIKAAYDPDNVFRINSSIPPAIAAGNGDRDGS
jgi:FAD/FMN-containing dehydrogenase